MSDFFPIETPYNSEDYKIMKAVTDKGIDSHLEGFTKSEFKKSPFFNNKFLWNIHTSELPILYRRLQDLHDSTGNEDYLSFLDDVQGVADVALNTIAGHDENDLEEMIDPYDPMDANQTINGFPTGNSDLNADGIDAAPAYSNGPGAFAGQAVEDYIDDDTISQEMMAEEEVEMSEAELMEMMAEKWKTLETEGKSEKSDFIADHTLNNKLVIITNDQDENGKFGESGTIEAIVEPSERQRATGYRLVNYIINFPSGENLAYLRSEFDKDMKENSSDSLSNKHSMNVKPENLDETTDEEKYEDVVFLQGQEADEAMDILNNDGQDAAMEYLKQWHQPGNHMGRNELPHGTQDKTYEKDGYIMAWNPYLPYIGLTYDTNSGINEDSQMKRHQAGQREKIVPLGQNAPHSQAAKK